MAEFSDTFTRPDGPLGSMSGPGGTVGPAYEQVTGTWSIFSGRPTPSGSPSPTVHQIVGVVGGLGNADLTIAVASGGGDALYARIVNGLSWVRARLRVWETTGQTTTLTYYQWQVIERYGSPATTTYTWAQNYGPLSAAGGHPEITTTLYADSTSQSTAPYFPDYDYWAGDGTYGGTAYPKKGSPFVAYSTQTGGYTYSAPFILETTTQGYNPGQYAINNGGSSTYIGIRTETVPGQISTNREVVLERCSSGIVTRMASANLTVVPTTLRFRVDGTTLSAYVNGGASPIVTWSDNLNQSINKHGFGRGVQSGTTEKLAAPGLDNFVFNTLDAPPSPPTLEFPVGGQIVDLNSTTEFRQRFNDPDLTSGDVRSKLQQRWKLSSEPDTSYRLREQSGPTGVISYSPGTFPIGLISWQGQDFDRSGQASGWSGVASFQSASAPTDVRILSPSAGQVITVPTSTVTWSTADQRAYRIQVTDAFGNVLPGRDTGMVTSTSRSYSMRHGASGTDEVIRLTIENNAGLVSPEVSVRVRISFTPPAASDIRIFPEPQSASITLQPVKATTSVIAVEYNEVWVRQTGKPETTFRLSKVVANGSSVMFRTPASGVDYEFMARAVGENGAFIDGPWRGATASAPITPPVAGQRAFGEGTFGQGTFGGPLA